MRVSACVVATAALVGEWQRNRSELERGGNAATGHYRDGGARADRCARWRVTTESLRVRERRERGNGALPRRWGSCRPLRSLASGSQVQNGGDSSRGTAKSLLGRGVPS